ncbi:unnamed protein product [Protopolystoma xenopodis]|uniref:DUS-like FMN-binding domain-containing protein n=1 Tax=Protopolystoma xenopodis TaxID=117903 RepID=A0A3S5AQH0_9PLAT|nr:unnamed protein product [Protopolystoma xenopodis]
MGLLLSRIQDIISSTVEIIRRLACMGVDWVTVHCRTSSQRSSQPALHHLLSEVIAAGRGSASHLATGCPLPIILNGDIQSMADADRAWSMTGCQGIMVARGLLSSPWLFDASHTGLTAVSSGHGQFIANRDLLSSLDLLLLKRAVNTWIDLNLRHSDSGRNFVSLHRQVYWMLEAWLDSTRRRLLHSLTGFSGLIDWLDDFWPLLEFSFDTRQPLLSSMSSYSSMSSPLYAIQ